MLDRTNASYDGAITKPQSRLEARTEAILRATLEQLAEVGYGALSFESIASRVGIAKTTVYRRYPTKKVLVQTAVEKFIDTMAGEPPDTGSLRGDLVATAQLVIVIVTSAVGQALLKLGLERPEPDLFEMSKDFEAKSAARNGIVASRALARGEIAKVTDLERLIDVLVAATVFKVAIQRETVDEVEIGRTVDLLLNGVARPALNTSRRKPSAPVPR